MKRIGILGGTFNPIHLGHLRAAEEIAEAFDLERMWLVPSAEPPHKRGATGDPLAPAEQRLAWARAAVAGNPRLGVDALEIERGGRSYSVDTVTALGQRIAPERPIFAIGCDAFAELGSWREPERLLELAHFAVMARPPAPPGSLAEVLPAFAKDEVELSPDGRRGRHRRSGTWLRLVEVTRLDISSSDIRARLRTGRSVRYLLPEEVRMAVERSGVYAAGMR